MKKIRDKGNEYMEYANENELPIIVLAGRPYHVDPEVNNSIDKLVCQLGAIVVSEDVISHNVIESPTDVLDQWTYHSRLYAAARYIKDKPQI